MFVEAMTAFFAQIWRCFTEIEIPIIGISPAVLLLGGMGLSALKHLLEKILNNSGVSSSGISASIKNERKKYKKDPSQYFD